jgi:3',5'-cyclic-AMP phosphodiesterase
MAPDQPPPVVQISDLHLRVGPRDEGSAAALAATVDAIGRLDPAPAAILVTGDLTETGSPREYERVRELLAPLTVPVHPIPGNHDDRDALCAAYADHPDIAAADGYVQYAVRIGPLRVLLCDTLDPGHGGGRLGAERLAWLRTQREADPEVPTVLALHHPPVLVGMTAFDAIALATDDRAALAEVLSGWRGAQGVVTGHVHRAITGRLGTCPVFVCPSSYRQAKLDLRPEGTIELGDDPPGYALHLLGDGGALLTHVQPI